MKKVVASLIVASFLALGAGIGHGEEKKETKTAYTECLEKYKDFVPGEDYAYGSILLGFDSTATKEKANKFIESHDKNNELEMESYYGFIELAVVRVPKGKEIEYVCKFYNMRDETIVDYAEPNYIMRILPANE